MQTAMKSHLQWLYDNQLDFNIPLEVIEDAEDRLEMEKQQIIYAHLIGLITSLETEATKQAEQYYNNNFKQE